MNLTPKQLRVLQLIRRSRKSRGFSPTMQELATALGVSRVTVFEHVEALVAKGALRRDPNKARSLSVSAEVDLPEDLEGESGFDFDGELPARQLHAENAEPAAARLAFPLVGKVAAGYPIEKFEQSETLALEDLFGGHRGASRGSTFALKVDGESMRDEGILDGDFVLIDRRNTARNGERVVALLPNGESTLKTYFREKDGRIRLQPANPDFAPIIVDDCSIQGIVIGVLRSYR
ncbi:MAG: transcriptional repressor LexA [Planctomycetota bacterium]